MIARTGKLFLIALGAIMIGACQKEGSAPTLLECRAQPYVPDVAVPSGFERDERESKYTSTAGSRRIKDIYVGKAASLAVRNFYLHYMQKADWQLLDEKLLKAVYLLNFKKGLERCEVRIERTPKGAFGSITKIRILIYHEDSPPPV